LLVVQLDGGWLGREGVDIVAPSSIVWLRKGKVRVEVGEGEEKRDLFPLPLLPQNNKQPKQQQKQNRSKLAARPPATATPLLF